MPQPVQFVSHGKYFRDDLGQEGVEAILANALEAANRKLNENVEEKKSDEALGQVKVSVVQQLGRPEHGNVLLQIQTSEDDSEPIDMICVNALDGKIKSEEDLADEICNKVAQHLTAKKTNGFLFSSSGSKFDARKLEDGVFSIDEDGYLTVNQKTVFSEDRALKAEIFRSSTIMRLIPHAGGVILVDDHDLVREDRDDPLTFIKADGAYSRIIPPKNLDLKKILEEWPGP